MNPATIPPAISHADSSQRHGTPLSRSAACFPETRSSTFVSPGADLRRRNPEGRRRSGVTRSEVDLEPEIRKRELIISSTSRYFFVLLDEKMYLWRASYEGGRLEDRLGGNIVRWVLIILGLLLLVIGVVWALQGTNILPYGQMAGHRRWIAIGGGLGIIGIVLIILSTRIRTRTA